MLLTTVKHLQSQDRIMDKLLDNTDPRKVAANMQALLERRGHTEMLTEDVVGY